MHVSTKIQFFKCGIDPKYTIAVVKETFTTNWWDRVWRERDHVKSREFRTRQGGAWYKLPEFTEFSPNYKNEREWALSRLIDRLYKENEEREAFIQASEKKIGAL